MSNYRLEGKTFVIDDYDRMPAFSSFCQVLQVLKEFQCGHSTLTEDRE